MKNPKPLLGDVIRPSIVELEVSEDQKDLLVRKVLTVMRPFNNYRRGDRITLDEEISKVLKTHADKVNLTTIKGK